MRFSTGGDFYPMIPEEIRELPLDLLRSHKVTTDPAVTERGIAEYEAVQSGEGALPVFYAPGKMGYTKYRYDQEAPAGWGQNVVSLLGAFRHQLDVQQRAQTQIDRVPVQDAVQAGQADGRSRLPQPTDDLDPNLRRAYRPIGRDVMPLNRVMEPVPVQQTVDAQTREQLGQDARLRAMNEVAQVREVLLEMTDQTIDQPWYVRM